MKKYLPLQSQTELRGKLNSVKNKTSMANIAKKELDPRTFPEICKSISQGEWLAIKDRIMMQTGKTEVAVWKWGQGLCQPQSLQERRLISKIVNQVLPIHTNYRTLFPL